MVGDVIWQSIKKACPAASAEEVAVTPPPQTGVFKATPVREFFVVFEERDDKTNNNKDMINVLNVALLTQAAKAEDAHDSVRKQCITTSFTVNFADKKATLPDGLKQLGRTLGLLRDSAIETVEGKIKAAIDARCSKALGVETK